MAFRSNDPCKSDQNRAKPKRAQTERACYELCKANEQMMSKFAFELIDCGPEQETQINAIFTVVKRKSSYSHYDFGSDSIEEYLRRDFSEWARVDPRDMFKEKDKVFLAGVSGSGKSTLGHSLLREWHEGRLWVDRFDFVFFVNAAVVMSLFTTGPYTIERALRALYPGVFKYIEFSDLAKFQSLIIVDSVDECGLQETYVGGELIAFESFIKSVVESPNNFCKIFAGSPLSCKFVHERLIGNVSCEVVVVGGLSEDQVRNCISKLCHPEKAGYVLQRIQENQTLLRLACLPVFTSIICQVLSENPSALIGTQTELFVWAYVLLLSRHLKKNRPFVDTSSYENLFNCEILLDTLLKLGKMAIDVVSTGTKVFEFDEFFRATEISSTLVTPFVVHRQKFLNFSSSTFVDFFAAVHLFSTRATFDGELIKQEYLGGVLPIYFGFLGASTRSSESPKIVRDFLQPLMKRSQTPPLDKHPLCGHIGEMVYRMNEDYPNMFMNLCYEFGNGFLLNDADVLWNNDAEIYVDNDQHLTRLFFFMKNLRVGRRRIKELYIAQSEREFTIDLCKQLTDVIISCGWKVNKLELLISSLNEEKMKILAPAICLVRGVHLHVIRVSSDECWMILLSSIEDAFKKKTLKLEKLRLPFYTNKSICAQMKKFVRVMFFP